MRLCVDALYKSTIDIDIDIDDDDDDDDDDTIALNDLSCADMALREYCYSK